MPREEQGADVVRVDAVHITVRPQGYVADKDVEPTEAFLRERKDELSALQISLEEKVSLLAATDERLKAALVEIDQLHAELNGNADMLSECQVCFCITLCTQSINHKLMTVLVFFSGYKDIG
jgi:2'-5' RNA ligase